MLSRVSEEGTAGGPGVPGRVRVAYEWFRAFRRTRPFWGGVWLVAGGWTVLRFSLSSLQLIVSTGFGGVAGYLVGGGMILCGLIPMALPSQRYTFGLIGVVLAVVSLVVSNLGGFLLGMTLGVLGGSMTVGWGAKRPRRRAADRPADRGVRAADRPTDRGVPTAVEG
ncbi:DUF6114 domain-containing protein [Streptomyces sp. NPDC055103]